MRIIRRSLTDLIPYFQDLRLTALVNRSTPLVALPSLVSFILFSNGNGALLLANSNNSGPPVQLYPVPAIVSLAIIKYIIAL